MGKGTGRRHHTPEEKKPEEEPLTDLAKEMIRLFAETVLTKRCDGLLKEYAILSRNSLTAQQVARTAFDANKTKNRYNDIPCVEQTRVRLKFDLSDQATDYIHANYITNVPGMMDPVERKERFIIATQGPTKSSVVDFWRMIWQEKVSTIIMLCSVMEGGKKKCEQYWPEGHDKTLYFHTLTVTNKGTRRIAHDLFYTSLRVVSHSKTALKQHFVNHVYWNGWPDKGVPLDASGAYRMLLRTTTFNSVAIHCSAGVGRTGTIIALDAALRTLRHGEELSVYNVVRRLRQCRFLACQTDMQYLYIHRSLLAFAVDREVLSKDQIGPFVAEYEALLEKRFPGLQDMSGEENPTAAVSAFPAR